MVPHSRASRSKHTRIEAAFRTSRHRGAGLSHRASGGGSLATALGRGIELRGDDIERASEILTPAAVDFVADLSRAFEPTRKQLLAARAKRQAELSAGGELGFLAETQSIRDGGWRVAETPRDLQVRKVEITGPTDRKMVINALNSGASVYMADFEDANTPSWTNLVEGQRNLIDAIERRISFTAPDGREYRLGEKTATLVVRPRGWHLVERHLTVDGIPVSGAVFDFGLYVFHNAKRLLKRGSGPYFYLPKLESHREARLWNEIFDWAEKELHLGHGKIKATVLVEVLPLAFEMEETLYELRTHSAGLNAGRWDYMFSIIKKLGDRKEFILPDRAQVTMTVPFMRAYTELLVKTCHRRGAFALGGMAAFIPSRRDPAVNETALAKVRDDKQREATDGFDGTWVAHPDLVGTAMSEFDRVFGDRRNQLDRQRPEVAVTPAQLLDVRVPGGTITEAGLRTNVSVGIQYIASWLRGTGAAAINNLMEDAATAEISRSQVWQWIHHGIALAEGPAVTAKLVRDVEQEELAKIRKAVGEEPYANGRFEDARRIFEEVALAEDFQEFLTIPAYEHID
ncbi:MAG: malate synthase A [Chloroflexi bacterium]|nr:MAG: malate synthase A [Chloroflexota bacterium]